MNMNLHKERKLRGEIRPSILQLMMMMKQQHKAVYLSQYCIMYKCDFGDSIFYNWIFDSGLTL